MLNFGSKKLNEMKKGLESFSVPFHLQEVIKLADENKVELIMRQTKINNVTFTLIDAKLPRFKEESLYEDKRIHYLVPRGLCFVFANNEYVHKLYGHPKFGNEGDFKHGYNNKLIVQKVFHRKENGECAHLSSFRYKNQLYLLLGSKNVHAVFRPNNIAEDVKLYTEARYDFATKITTCFNNIYGQNIAKQINIVADYIANAQNTFCFEACLLDSQHLVKYDADTLLFFGITGSMYCDNGSLCMNPLEDDNFFKKFNLKTVSETITTRSGFLQEDEQKIASIIENGENSEGAVVNCLDKNGKVIYVYKHKNFTYVFMRAVREQMRKKASVQSILNRIKNLHIKHPQETELTKQLLQFNAYFRSQSLENQETFFSQWVTWEEKFMNLTEEQRQKYYDTYMELVKNNGTLISVMYVVM